MTTDWWDSVYQNRITVAELRIGHAVDRLAHYAKQLNLREVHAHSMALDRLAMRAEVLIAMNAELNQLAFPSMPLHWGIDWAREKPRRIRHVVLHWAREKPRRIRHVVLHWIARAAKRVADWAYARIYA